MCPKKVNRQWKRRVARLRAERRIQRERLQQLQVKQLEEADRLKDQILSIISHELRTPLNFITGFTSLLEDGAGGALTETQASYLSKILKGADRMTRLIDDLLLMSQLTTGTCETQAGPLVLSRVFSELAESFQGDLAEKGCRLRLEVPADLPILMTDERHLQRVLASLLENALKFSPPGSNIVLSAGVKGEECWIELRDQGIGIRKDQQQQIFERFFQVDMSSTRKAGGTGLGLAIAKHLVELLGGRIGVESEPGQGALFWLALPLSAEG